MERRNFVKSTILGGLGISIFSLDAFAKYGVQDEILKKSIIVSENHIRHGLFNPSVGQVHHFNSWFTNFKKDVFYKNGFSEGLYDMINLSFSLDNNDYKIHYLQDELLAIINGEALRFNLNNDRSIQVFSNEKFICEAHRFSGSKSIDVKGDMFVLSLESGICIEENEIKQDEIVLIDKSIAKEKVKIKSGNFTNHKEQKSGIILTISKNT
ncbi:MAG: hypothetical protein ACI81Y_001897 [Glaciecola sp.]|jgi:hypothetical protein